MRIILVLLASLMLAAPAYATGGGEGNNTGCNGVGNPNSPCEPGDGGNGGGGDPTGGTNTNTNTNTNDNSNTNTNSNDQWQGQAQGQAQGQIQGQIATGGSVGDTTATGGSVGDVNTTFNFGGGEEGEGSFNSTSSVGDTTAVSGSTSTATGGEGGSADATALGGTAIVQIGGGYGQGECFDEVCEGGSGTLNSNAENNVDVSNDNSSTATNGDQSTNVNVQIGGEEGPLTASSQSVDANATVAEGAVQIDNSNNSVYKEAARTAATSFASVCTSGAAAQGNTYGLSLAVTSTQCSYLMQADAYMAMGNIEKATKFVDKAARSASIKGFMSNIRTVITLGIL